MEDAEKPQNFFSSDLEFGKHGLFKKMDYGFF